MGDIDKTHRESDDDDQFNMPADIIGRAEIFTDRGDRIMVKPNELIKQMRLIDKALNGDSNDAEHDALYHVREWLSDIYEDPDLWAKRG